jgi:hypothetical protein
MATPSHAPLQVTPQDDDRKTKRKKKKRKRSKSHQALDHVSEYSSQEVLPGKEVKRLEIDGVQNSPTLLKVSFMIRRALNG